MHFDRLASLASNEQNLGVESAVFPIGAFAIVPVAMCPEHQWLYAIAFNQARALLEKQQASKRLSFSLN
jgi:hypothetical protein